MIDEVIIEPRCLSQYSFLRNPQPFWNGAAAYVPNSTMNLDAIQLILYKRVRHQHFACLCHQAFPLVGDSQPIADLRLSIMPIERQS